MNPDDVKTIVEICFLLIWMAAFFFTTKDL